jgi:hypothetical protein
MGLVGWVYSMTFKENKKPSCVENTFDTQINVFLDEIRTYE